MDATLLAGIMGLVGALIGGAIGGYGSYLGGIKGAKKNSEIQTKIKKEHAIRRISIQLIFTSELINELMNYEGEFVPIEALDYIVYDKSWVEQICYVDNLPSDKVGAIITWFHLLESLSIINKSGRSMSKKTLNGMIGCKADEIHEIAILLVKP